MPTQADVRAIARALPGAIEQPGRFAFGVVQPGKPKPKDFVWVWLERIDPKKARVPNPKVIAIRVANETEKATLLGADATKFFTEPHYNGYPAVLVRLDEVTRPELRSLLTEAWRCAAPAPAKSKTEPAKAKAPPASRGTKSAKAARARPGSGRRQAK